VKYINKDADVVVDALKWDGTNAGKSEMRLKFSIPDKITIETGDYALKTDYFSHGILKSGKSFEKHFKPISDARVLIVEELKKGMLLKLQECQKEGKTDEWRELGLSVLFQRLAEELMELQVELKNIELGSGSADFGDARRECADVANYAAMIHDALNGMELEAMHKRKEKNES
jgi:hypothetical protein